MEFIPFILAIVLLVPIVYLIMVILWIANAMVTILTKGPRKGVEIIRSW